MSAHAHLASIDLARLRLGEVASRVSAATTDMIELDALIVAAVGESPTLPSVRRIPEASLMLRDTLADAQRLCEHIDSLLSTYRRTI